MNIAALALACAPLLFGAGPDGWLAGVAKTDITPETPMWLAGYAARNHESTSTLHPLWLKALALQDAEGHRAVIVTSDILGFPQAVSNAIRDQLQAKLGLDRAHVILNSSHTHSGPVLSGSLVCIYPLDDAGKEKSARYTERLQEQAVQTVEAALAALQPARLASGGSVVRFGLNRRNNNEAQILDATELKGPLDHAVPVLSVTTPDGAPLALLFGYACHCTTLDGYEWSGDYAGFAQLAVERAHPGCTALFFAGCGSNINPMPRRTVALAQQYGDELAAAVERALKDAPAPLDATLTTAYTEIELPLDPAPTRDALAAIVEPAYMRIAAQTLIAELDAGRPLRTSYPYPVQVWRLGAQPLVALGGETVVDYAIAVKKLLGRNTFVLGYSNDVMAYIPSETVLTEGGYEGATAQLIYGLPSKWTSGIEKQILDTVTNLANQPGNVK